MRHSERSRPAATATAHSPVNILRLRDLLRSDILHGAYADGLLPSEAELMIAHRASRATVRGALALLSEEGMVIRRQGIGTVVTSHVATTKLIEAHGVKQPGPGNPFGDLHAQVLEAGVIPCPGPVARLLGAEPGELCARIEYVSWLGADTNALCTNYVLFPEGKALLATQFRIDWYTYLEEAGVEIGDDDFLIGALVADEALAERINTSPGVPLLYMEQVIRDRSGRPFNAAHLYLRADRMMLLSHASMPHDTEDGEL